MPTIEDYRYMADKADGYALADYPEFEPWIRGTHIGWHGQTEMKLGIGDGRESGVWWLDINGVSYLYPNLDELLGDVTLICRNEAPVALRGLGDDDDINAALDAIRLAREAA